MDKFVDILIKEVDKGLKYSTQNFQSNKRTYKGDPDLSASSMILLTVKMGCVQDLPCLRPIVCVSVCDPLMFPIFCGAVW